MPTPEYLVEFYRNEYTGEHDQGNIQESVRDYYRSHAAELKDYAGEGRVAIADIGCSIPVFLREAKNSFAERYGVDYSQEAHGLGARWGVTMLTPQVFHQEIPDSSIDVLRYSHVLEHLIDPRGSLKEDLFKLKPGGLLYITQPNFPVMRAEYFHRDLLDSEWPKHLHFFNPISIKIMLEELGVRIVKFLTHENDEGAFVKYMSNFDALYSGRELELLEKIEEKSRGIFARWPYFSGENMGIYGYKE